jgi:hypothetical protein
VLCLIGYFIAGRMTGKVYPMTSKANGTAKGWRGSSPHQDETAALRRDTCR